MNHAPRQTRDPDRRYARPSFDEWELWEHQALWGLRGLDDFLRHRATGEVAVLLGVVGALAFVARSILTLGESLTVLGLVGAVTICSMLFVIGLLLSTLVSKREHAPNSKKRSNQATHHGDAPGGAGAPRASPRCYRG